MPHHHGSVEHHDHSSGHARPVSDGALRVAFFVNLVFTVVELFGGWWSGSIAVLTDAMHDGGDCLVLGTAWWLQRVSMKGRDQQYSYGYGRYSMLGGWLTSVILIAGAVLMLFASIPRLQNPELPDAASMVGIAIFGLLMNGFAAWKLHSGGSLNERGAYLHLLEDVLGWAAVLVGAILIALTGWPLIDPLLSIGISIFILFNAVGTLKRGTRILMQEVPPEVDIPSIRARLLAIPNVLNVHDQHTWSLDGSYTVHTVHLAMDTTDPARAITIKQEAREALTGSGIHHATIELEWPGEECGTIEIS